MSPHALDALVRHLEEEFRAQPRGGRVAELLAQYACSEEDWTAFALFSPEHYTRNLIARQPRFELMILCWGAGQESPIHNHEGQDCWMAILRGEMEELRYAPPEPGVHRPLRAKSTFRFEKGQVAFIRDEMGLHLVRPAQPRAEASRAVGAEDAGAVSLHLYAQPYDDCNVYCPDTGLVTRRRLGHYSVRGRILPSAVGT